MGGRVSLGLGTGGGWKSLGLGMEGGLFRVGADWGTASWTAGG